ncbi:MAG: GAF domain-containing sensor histidine kinase [bacterium]|nr:GAF domain-containing sensor histidine kinase [bacterium]
MIPARTPDESDSQKLQRRNHELSVINAIAEALHREVDLARVLERTLALTTDLFDLQTGWVWLYEDNPDVPVLAAVRNLPPVIENNPDVMDPEDWCTCLDTYLSGDMTGAANVNIITCSRLKGLVNKADGLRYHASIPLYAQEKKLGILNVVSRDWRKLTNDELKLLYTVGDLLSIAIERARLFQRTAALAAAEERNRLAREIHDTLAQGLAAIAFRLETADALLESGQTTDRAHDMVRQALQLAQDNLEEARRSVLDLRAAPLEGRTLADALEALARDTAASAHLQLDFKANRRVMLPPRVEAGLYRIAQEALNNVVRHARASSLTVELLISDEDVRLTMMDDGQGFNAAEPPPDRFGLVGLNERARLLGGVLKLWSAPGQGTYVHVTVPLKK